MTNTSVVRGHTAGSDYIDYDYLFGKISEGLEWQEQALCAQIDPEMWFPEDGGPNGARKICGDCPVKQQCLQHALDNNEMHGIWGGLSYLERRVLSGKRKEKWVPSAKRSPAKSTTTT